MKNLILISFILFSNLFFAQAPQGINYQGIAYTASGAIVANGGTVNIRLSILDNSVIGPILYSETHTIQINNNQGIFNLVIGQGTSLLGTFSTIPWGVGNKFLKVELDPLGLTTPVYTVTGTSQLMSVPYALYSNNAQNAQTAENVNAANAINNVPTIADLRQYLDPIVGDVVFVKGYYTENDGVSGTFIWNTDTITPTPVDNGGTIILSNVSTEGRWLRVIEGNSVNVKWFGAKADCKYNPECYFSDIDNTTDNYEFIQNAINFCISKGMQLIIPAGDLIKELVTDSNCNATPFPINKIYSQYKVLKTLSINGKLNIKGQPGTAIIGDIREKSAPIFKITDCNRGKIEDISILGYKYQTRAGIEFIKSDNKTSINNQGIRLNNVQILNCQHGVYCNDSFTIDRIVLDHCDLSSNWIAGFYIDGDPEKLGHNNTPITFINTIMNANGTQDWLKKGDPSIHIFEVNSYQLYAKSVNNLSYIGGQISNHRTAKAVSLVYLENGSGANFQGVDIEGDEPAVDRHPVSNVFYVKNFEGFNIMQSHIWQLNTTKDGAVFYFEGNCGNVTIQNINLDNIKNRNLGNFTYSVNVVDSNFYNVPPYTNDPAINDPTNNFTTTFLYFDGPTHNLSLGALCALDKSKMEILTNIEGPIVPSPKFNSIFSNNPSPAVNSDGTKYLITNNYSPLTTTPYIEKNVSNASVIFIQIECTQNSFEPVGQLYIQEFDGLGNQIGSITFASLQATNTINDNFYNYVKKDISVNTKKIRYGFVNKNGGCEGCNIPDHATVKGLTVYIDYRNPISKRQRIRTDY